MITNASALFDNELSFQPIVDLRTQTVVRYEALSRFDYFAPYEVQERIKKIESLGLATEFDRRTLWYTHALLQDPALFFGKKININITGDSFSNPVFLMWLRSFIPKIVNRRLLCLELTETLPITDLATGQSVIDFLVSKDVEVYLDDAGAGHMTQNLARSLFNYSGVKIDGSIVNGWSTNPSAYQLTKSIVTLAKSRGIPIIAEFVDTPEKIGIALDLGIEMAQGFKIGQPMPFPESPESVEARLKRL